MQGKPKSQTCLKITEVKISDSFWDVYLVFWWFLNVFTGWNVLLLVRIKDFLLIPSKTRCHLKKSKTKSVSKRKMIRSLNQAKAEKKKNQRNAELIRIHPAFNPEGESATLLQGTKAGTSTQRINMKSDQASDEERKVTRMSGMSLSIGKSQFFKKSWCSNLSFELSCLCEK